MSMTKDQMGEQATAMFDAADGYADDELVWFAGHQWSAGRLRELGDEMIEAWSDAVMAEMVEKTRGFHTNF